MGERDVVWEHGENLFRGFKCKYCVKEFCCNQCINLETNAVFISFLAALR
jgi:hypothetical protein